MSAPLKPSPKPISTVYRPHRSVIGGGGLLGGARYLAWMTLTGPLLALLVVGLILASPAMAQPAAADNGFGAPAVDEAAVEGGDAEADEPAENVVTKMVGLAKTLDIWLIPFGIATIIAIWFTTERLVVLRSGRVIPKPFVTKFLSRLEEGDLEADEAIERCEENGSPIASIFAHGVRKWGKPSVEVEQAIIDGGERQVAGLRKHLRLIHGIATVTPLIGLLGTVWGMYDAFNNLATAGAAGNTEKLAEGIALALVTTAAGLVIAIPCLIAYMYLSGRVDSLVMAMDDLAQRVVNAISAEALNESVPVRRAKKSA